MNSGPPIFNEICSALRAARLSSRKGLGELISKRRGLPGVQAFFGVRRSSARLLVQIPGSVAKMSCAAIARHAALGTAWLSLSLGAFAALGEGQKSESARICDCSSPPPESTLHHHRQAALSGVGG